MSTDNSGGPSNSGQTEQDLNAWILARLDQLQAENDVLLNRLKALENAPAVTSVALDRIEPKLEGPEKFTGVRAKLQTFLTDCQTVFEGQPSHYTTNRSHIYYIADRLGGQAKDW